MASGALLYRNIATAPGDKMGFPLRVEDKTVYVWPEFVKHVTFYCVLDEESSMLLNPEAGEDVNPVILTFRLDGMSAKKKAGITG